MKSQKLIIGFILLILVSSIVSGATTDAIGSLSKIKESAKNMRLTSTYTSEKIVVGQLLTNIESSAAALEPYVKEIVTTVSRSTRFRLFTGRFFSVIASKSREITKYTGNLINLERIGTATSPVSVPRTAALTQADPKGQAQIMVNELANIKRDSRIITNKEASKHLKALEDNINKLAFLTGIQRKDPSTGCIIYEALGIHGSPVTLKRDECMLIGNQKIKYNGFMRCDANNGTPKLFFEDRTSQLVAGPDFYFETMRKEELIYRDRYFQDSNIINLFINPIKTQYLYDASGIVNCRNDNFTFTAKATLRDDPQDINPLDLGPSQYYIKKGETVKLSWTDLVNAGIKPIIQGDRDVRLLEVLFDEADLIVDVEGQNYNGYGFVNFGQEQEMAGIKVKVDYYYANTTSIRESFAVVTLPVKRNQEEPSIAIQTVSPKTTSTQATSLTRRIFGFFRR